MATVYSGSHEELREYDMSWISVWFLRIGVVAGLCGMTLGIAMGASGDHSQMPLHAHVNLIGWVTMVLYGLVYRVVPEAAENALARWQFALAVGGLAIILPGLALIGMNDHQTGTRFAIIGSFLTLAAMMLFAVIVFRATRKESASSVRRAAPATR